MGSYIQIDSISIDLADSDGKRDDAGKCEHFSIRGYVSEVRKKDWKLCWPFPVPESDRQPSLPPLDVPKYKCSYCSNSQQEIAAKDIRKDDQTDFNCCSTGCKSHTNCTNAALESGIQNDPMPDTIERREIDLNSNLSSVNGCSPIISIENEKKSGVGFDRIIDLEIGVEDNLIQQVTSVPSPKIYPDPAQEVRTTETGCEGNEVSYARLSSNLICMDKSSTGFGNGGTPSADNQCQKDLVTTGMEAPDTTSDRTTGPAIESVACNHAVPAASMDNMVEDDFEDHPEKSTGLSRRRPRKVRLMTDLLSENGKSKTEQIAVQEPPSNGTSNMSAASQAHSIFPGKMDTQGDLTPTTMGQSRKRKLILDGVQKPASKCFQRVESEVQNLEGNSKATDSKATDTIFNNRSNSKGVPAGMGLQDAKKSSRSRSEPERSQLVGKKKNKKIQAVDYCLIPEPQGQRRENEDTIGIADKAYASKTVSSTLASCAFKGKGMDNYPFHTLRTENDFNLSKEKGKMLRTDGELNSLSCQKNDMPLGDPFAYLGGKMKSNVPVNIPIPPVQRVVNGKGLQEGLHPSLNSYLAAHVYNNKCIHQMENHLPFSLPFQESTSKVPQLIRKDSDTNVLGGPSIPSRHTTNAISGKGVRCEEITGVGHTQKTVEAAEQLGLMKRYHEQTARVSEQGTLDDIPMEIVELLAKNQYERCLPDVENRSSMLENSPIRRKAQTTAGTSMSGKEEMSLLKDGQKEKSQVRHKKNNRVSRGQNVKPSKRKQVHFFSPFDGSNLGANNLCPPQSPFRFQVPQSQKKPSSGFQFSPMVSNQLCSARNGKFNGSIEEQASSNATLQSMGGCSLHKNILNQDNEASRIWASMNPNHVSLGYDIHQKVVSQPTSSNMDITSPRSGALHKQNMKRDIDLNYANMNAGLEKPSRNTGPATFSRINGEYPFPCKHNGIEPHQNLRGSLDLYSNETIPAMHLLSLMDAGMQSRTSFNVGVSGQMLKRPSYPGDCNTKLEIGASKAHGTLKRHPPDYYGKSYSSDKPHGCFMGSQTFGASSSTQHDGKKVIRDTGFNGQNSTKLGKKENMKSPNSTLQNGVSKQFSLLHLGTETSLKSNSEVHGTHKTSVPFKIIPGNSCTVNRNPADFTMPETGNVYMIRGEDLKFEKSIPKNKSRFPIPHEHKQQRNLKGTKMKEHSKH